VALLMVLSGGSFHGCAAQVGVDRHTVRRWWQWLRDRGDEFGLFLRARFYELGRAVDTVGFWQLCWQVMPLSGAMAWLDRMGVIVP
jgi:hypothetical protein